MTRHAFAGGNTPLGFYNLFDNILPIEKAKKRVFLKGSSGSGKSTFLKKVAAKLENNGYSIDIFHCSNDASSLDAVSCHEKGLSLTDGTAPHVCDPEIPAVVDIIVNFADFIDSAKVLPFTDEIRNILALKKRPIAVAYGYLAAAGSINAISSSLYEGCVSVPKLNVLCSELRRKLELPKQPQKVEKNRRLFAGAITPDGNISYADTIVGNYEITGLHAEDGMGAAIILSELQKAANASGLYTESFYCPINPNKPEYLIIPELNKAFATINDKHNCKISPHTDIYLSECSALDSTAHIEHELRENSSLMEMLLKNASRSLSLSRKLHDRIESIYIDSIDFERLTVYSDKLADELTG